MCIRDSFLLPILCHTPADAQAPAACLLRGYGSFAKLGAPSGYSGIWQAYRNEFVAAISTAFSMGGIFGFFLKILIDSCLFPQVPPLRHAVALPPRAKTKTT